MGGKTKMTIEKNRKLPKAFAIIVALCAVGAMSLVIFIPQVRELIIKFGEKSVGRPLTHEVWHERFIQWEKMFLLADIILLIEIIFVFNVNTQCNDITETKRQAFFGDKLANGTSISDLKKWVGISAIFFLVAHSYCFFNALYNHDSLMIFQNNTFFQTSIGRFLRPYYTMLFRGMIVAPWLIGYISFIFLMASAYLILNLLNIRSVKCMCAATAMLTTSTTLTLLNATYIHDSDAYMLALLLSVSGAYIAIRHGKYFVLSVSCMALSMGLYQSYIQVAVLLLMFDVFREVLKNKSAKDIMRKCAVYLCIIVISFVVYWCLAKIVQCLYQVPMLDTYNGMANVGHYKGFRHLIFCFIGSYVYVLRSFINPIAVHKVYVLAARFTLLFAGIWAVGRVLVMGKLSKINFMFAAILICLFPFGINFIYFITQGMEHDLMTFSFAVAPLLIFPLIAASESCDGKSMRNAKIAVHISFAVIAFGNIIFANQTYVKKDLEAQSTISVVNRIIDRIEQTDGYVAGETEVCIIGKLEENPLVISKRAGFDYGGTGNQNWVSATYNIEHYISYYLAYPYKRYYEESTTAVDNRLPEWTQSTTTNHAVVIDSLDVFPAKDCVALQDGILYIRIGY